MVRNIYFNKSNFNKKKEKGDNNKEHKEKYIKKSINNSKLSIFHFELKDYLYIIIKTSFFLILKKQIRLNI